MTKEVICPPGVPAPTVPYSPAVKAKGFIFVSGQVATDFKNGLAPEAAVSSDLPYYAEDTTVRQSRFNLANIKRLLEAGGSSLENGVWLNQFYPNREGPSAYREIVAAYHEVRRQVMGSHIPPSTSIVQEELMVPDATVVTDMIAVVPGERPPKQVFRPTDVLSPVGSAFAPAVSVGDYVFVAGQMAATGETGLAPEARANPHMWNECQIKMETSYTLRLVENGLRAAGASKFDAVKLQVYLGHIEELARMDEVWREFFGDNLPARTVIPAKNYGMTEGRIEINAIALKSGNSLPREVIVAPGVPRLCPSEPHAMRAGDFVFLSTLMAVDDHGLMPSAQIHPRMPYFGCQAEREMRAIMEKAAAICRAAGTTLDLAVRMQCFLVDLNDLDAVFRVMREAWPTSPPAFTAVRVPAPLPVPTARVLVDLTAAMP